MLGHLADDCCELSGGHVRSFALLDVPKLDEYLGPSLRIGPAVQRREMPRLDFGHVVARLHRPAAIVKDQSLLGMSGCGFQQPAERNVRSLELPIVYCVHLGYSIFQHF